MAMGWGQNEDYPSDEDVFLLKQTVANAHLVWTVGYPNRPHQAQVQCTLISSGFEEL